MLSSLALFSATNLLHYVITIKRRLPAENRPSSPKIASMNVCQRLIFCDFPSFSGGILTATLQIGTHNMGFPLFEKLFRVCRNHIPSKGPGFWSSLSCADNGRRIFIHLQCWEVLLFLTILRQWCIKIRVLRAEDFYTPLALNCQKGSTSQLWRCYRV